LKEAHSYGWYKLKPVSTIDAVVVEASATKQSVSVALYDCGVPVIIAKVRTADKNNIGRVAEIDFDSVGSRGNLRFARFKGWRDDKPASECLISQLEK
jgi:ATP-dependent DNA ligase